MTAERDQLASEKGDLQDRLLRGRAEFDNFRKRTERERSDYIQYAAMEMVKDILPVLDDFERALKVQTADREYAKGIELIYTRLYDSLKKMGLEPIATEGQPFDPNLHQAIERVPSKDADDQASREGKPAGSASKRTKPSTRARTDGMQRCSPWTTTMPTSVVTSASMAAALYQAIA